MRLLLLLSSLSLLIATHPHPAWAVIIDSGDGTGNAGPPAQDPGFHHLGRRGSLSVVYIGEGWILTANHVGAGDVTFDGTVYPWVPGSSVRLDNGDGTFADLLMFQVLPHPALPTLPIRAADVQIGDDLILIGHGYDRGPATSWDDNGPPPPGPIYGYDWDTTGRTMRWGENEVDGFPMDQFGTRVRVLGNEAFYARFDSSGMTHECIAANGDSGGAAFDTNGELAGLVYAIGTFQGQPPDTALYGNLTYSADLPFYRDDIVAIRALPEPAGALPAAVAMLFALDAHGRRRRRRPRAHHPLQRRTPEGECLSPRASEVPVRRRAPPLAMAPSTRRAGIQRRPSGSLKT
jgi:hypothetical protein